MRVLAHYILIMTCCFHSCASQDKTERMKETSTNHTNRLIDATSPYLLQHAHNPVDWYPWGEEALKKAKSEDKPIIVSIGYSACHWCHVMERESFENDSIAAIMNKYFVCIKVDREERPDVDQVYMDAVQAMGLQGGWPLNVFLTPSQKPFYGGTYFPPQQWAQILESVAKAYSDNRTKLEQSAEQFTQALTTSELKKYGLTSTKSTFQLKTLNKMHESFENRYDKKNGGLGSAPKFPMPVNWSFLLRYYNYSNDANALKQIILTLNEMAYGGIYDQVGGGFARYSVDDRWFAPHFEKMLYDNGQLLSLYSEAYALTGKQLYKNVVYQTIEWLEREMTSKESGFYSALDADSDGEEGKYYVWQYNDFANVLGTSAPIMSRYYNVTEEGNWEHGNNILHRSESNEHFVEIEDISLKKLEKLVSETNEKLYNAREKNIRPGLDDKILAGWNALAIKGLVDAYNSFAENKFLKMALNNANFIESKMRNKRRLFRTYKDGKVSIDAYLEDYSLVIQAYIALYQATFDEIWLRKSVDLTDYVMEQFYDDNEGMFFFTANNSEQLIARKKEIFDNVIPASNSVMARNLYDLGIITDNETYKEMAESMMSQIASLINENTSYLGNWAILYSQLALPTPEIVIIGPDYEKLRIQLAQKYMPNKIIMGAKATGNLPLLKDKYAMDSKTTIYVCYDKTCKKPVFTVEEALQQITSR